MIVVITMIMIIIVFARISVNYINNCNNRDDYYSYCYYN